MKLDTSSYYPESPLDHTPYMPHRESHSSDPEDKNGDEGGKNGIGDDLNDNDEKSSAPVPESVPDLPPSALDNYISGVSAVLSWVLVPLLMPVYATILAFSLSVLSFVGATAGLVYTLIVFGFNVAIPSVLILLLKKIGIVRDVGLNDQKERFLPYIICIACLLGTAVFMHFKSAPAWLVMFFLGGVAAGIVEVIVNRWWKISVHAAGIAGVVALLSYLMIYQFSAPSIEIWLIISVILAGMLGAARVWMSRHTCAQVLAGYAVGFACVYLMMLFS